MKLTIEGRIKRVSLRVPVLSIRFSTPKGRQQARSRARWQRFLLAPGKVAR